MYRYLSRVEGESVPLVQLLLLQPRCRTVASVASAGACTHYSSPLPTTVRSKKTPPHTQHTPTVRQSPTKTTQQVYCTTDPDSADRAQSLTLTLHRQPRTKLLPLATRPALPPTHPPMSRDTLPPQSTYHSAPYACYSIRGVRAPHFFLVPHEQSQNVAKITRPPPQRNARD